MNAQRLFDLGAAILLLLPAFVLCTACAVVLAVELRGNPLFVQVRVGRSQRTFRMVKLRTMWPGTREAGTHLVAPSAVTPFGRIVRASRVDELPQLLNVIAGSMSIVGPRPCLRGQLELIAARETRGVFAVRPGIIGPAQAAGIDMSTPELLAAVDTACLAPWSLAADCHVILATLLPGARGAVPAE